MQLFFTLAFFVLLSPSLNPVFGPKLFPQGTVIAKPSLFITIPDTDSEFFPPTGFFPYLRERLASENGNRSTTSSHGASDWNTSLRAEKLPSE